MIITIDVVKGLFALAGLDVLKIKPLIDGYGCQPDDPRYFETPPRCVWWFVKTKYGWIEVGGRKRVISIDWSDTSIRELVTQDDTTGTVEYVHAWTNAKALEYLTCLADKLKERNEIVYITP